MDPPSPRADTDLTDALWKTACSPECSQHHIYTTDVVTDLKRGRSISTRDHKCVAKGNIWQHKKLQGAASLAYGVTSCRPRGTIWAAGGAGRKDKLTDHPELWPGAISRHQSRGRTELRLPKTHDQRLAPQLSGRARVLRLTEWNGRYRPETQTHTSSQTKHCPQETHCSVLGVEDDSWRKKKKP